MKSVMFMFVVLILIFNSFIGDIKQIDNKENILKKIIFYFILM